MKPKVVTHIVHMNVVIVGILSARRRKGNIMTLREEMIQEVIRCLPDIEEDGTVDWDKWNRKMAAKKKKVAAEQSAFRGGQIKKKIRELKWELKDEKRKLRNEIKNN